MQQLSKIRLQNVRAAQACVCVDCFASMSGSTNVDLQTEQLDCQSHSNPAA